MRSWVFALPTNREFWAWDKARQDYTPRVISTEQARRIVEETKRAIEHWKRLAPAGGTAYTPPVLREHVREGARQGSVLDVKLAGQQERRGLWLLVDWLDATARDIEALKSQHVSIGIEAAYKDGTGETFGPIVDELSLTEHPRLRAIGSIQDTLTLRLADAIDQRGHTMDSEEGAQNTDAMALIEARLSALEEGLTAVKTAIEALVAGKEEEAETAVETVDVTASDEEDGEEEENVRAGDVNALAVRLSDLLVPKIIAQIEAKRSGATTAPAAPSGNKKPQTPEAKINAARAKGLKGLDAIRAALK